MSDERDEGQFRVFCAYPQWCRAETYAESEAEAERLADGHVSHNPTHQVDYERVGEAESDGSAGVVEDA